MQRREPEVGRRRDDVAPLRAGADASDPALRVDLDTLELVGLDEDHVVQCPERLGVVSGALGGDLHPVRAGEVDDLDHVLCVGRHGDERRLLDDGEVEGLRGGVPAVPTGLDHGALETRAQGAEGRNRRDPRATRMEMPDSRFLLLEVT